MTRKSLDDVFEDDDYGMLDVRPGPEPRDERADRALDKFEAVNAFYETHGREPRETSDAGMQEKILARRLSAMRDDPETRAQLAEADRHGLLGAERAGAETGETPRSLDDVLDDEELDAGGDIHELKHVTPRARRRPDYVARQRPCPDFDAFEPLFDAVAADLGNGRRTARRFRRGSEIDVGHVFILRGMMTYVAERSETYYDERRNPNARLRVVYANGTESDILMRSFARALYYDRNGRRVSPPEDEAVFAGEREETDAPGEDDIGTGVIYVVKSLSDDPRIAPDRDFLHKIGVTSGEPERRLRGVENDPTFLLAPVELVATYRLYNVRRTRLEHLLHAFFAPARADVTIPDRFGRDVKPREWFFVTPDLVREAIDRVQDGTLHKYFFDARNARITRVM